MTKKPEAKKPEPIKLNDRAIAKLSNLMQGINTLQGQMRAHIEGYKDGRELEGDWDLNTQTWTMTKREPPKKD